MSDDGVLFHDNSDTPNTNSLQWLIDKQKSEYTEIQKQLRRYLVLSVTVIAVRGFAALGGNFQFFPTINANRLVQEGLLWHIFPLPPGSASMFTGTLTVVTGILTGFGGGILIGAIRAAISVEIGGCRPRADMKMALYDYSEELEKWVGEEPV